VYIKDVLFELSRLDGPAGFENKITDYIIELTLDFVDEAKKDEMGNLILFKKGNKNGEKILLEAHVDEIGLVISKRIEGNFMAFSTDGGVDPKILPGQRVRFTNRKGERIKGVVGYLSPHFRRNVEKLRMDDLFIDFGIQDIEIEVGDVGVIDVEPVELNGDLVSGKAFDNRASCAILIDLLRRLKNVVLNLDLYALFAVREEFGSSGAVGAVYGIRPNCAIVFDVTHADVKDPTLSDVRLGKGPVFSHGTVVDGELLREFEEIANSSGIPFQREAVPGRSGTDTDLIQLVRDGVKTMLISIPLRYMHTPTEVLSLKDLNLTVRLMTEFLMRKG